MEWHSVPEVWQLAFWSDILVSYTFVPEVSFCPDQLSVSWYNPLKPSKLILYFVSHLSPGQNICNVKIFCFYKCATCVLLTHHFPLEVEFLVLLFCHLYCTFFFSQLKWMFGKNENLWWQKWSYSDCDYPSFVCPSVELSNHLLSVVLL